MHTNTGTHAAVAAEAARASFDARVQQADLRPEADLHTPHVAPGGALDRAEREMTASVAAAAQDCFY